MTGQSKNEYFKVLQSRYIQCNNRQEKSAIIDEVEVNLGLVRKSAIRALNRKPLVNRKPRRGRGTTYGYDLIRPLSQIWSVAGNPCSKRLKPQISELINRLKTFEEIKLYGNQESLLKSMSPFTIDRLLGGRTRSSSQRPSSLWNQKITTTQNFNTYPNQLQRCG